MIKLIIKKIFLVLIFLLFTMSSSFSEIIDEIEINGNTRISNETIIIFSKIDKNSSVDENILNDILFNLYETNFFSDVSVKLEASKLIIYVQENPIVQNISYTGIKAQKIRDEVTKNLKIKPRSSYSEILLKKDKDIAISVLQNLGYYFATVDTYIEQLDDNAVNINYQINLGEKSKIKKISFLGDKVFKSSKLRNIIVSEEYKFWKFLSGKKFLNENLTKLDTRLLKNFYLNNGYYNVEVSKSYAKLINNSLN